MHDASAKEIEAWSTDAPAGFADGQAEALAGLVLALALKCASLAQACRQALEAEALMRGPGLPVTRPHLGLHVGEVFHGNVGSPDRLDLTVVGPTVNEASRIAAMCRSAEREVLLSSAFAVAARGEDRAGFVSVGRFASRGVGRARELFTLEREVGGLDPA